jgi:di/tricarboxylate transporter
VLAVATGCISTGAARRSIDTSVIMVMGAALGLAQAVEQSGLSDVVAVSIQGASASVGPLGVLIIVYMAGMVLTEIVTNVAAAALLFPVALGAATALGVDSRPFILATSISAAMSLATPLGYQTNMMVYGPGGYRFTDFLRMGLPLQLGCGAVAITTISLLYDVSF